MTLVAYGLNDRRHLTFGMDLRIECRVRMEVCLVYSACYVCLVFRKDGNKILLKFPLQFLIYSHRQRNGRADGRTETAKLVGTGKRCEST